MLLPSSGSLKSVSLLRTPGFYSRRVHMGFVANKVSLDRVFLEVVRFSAVYFILINLAIDIASLNK
jgi:hypothetical protein